jgi:hypothetical protein
MRFNSRLLRVPKIVFRVLLIIAFHLLEIGKTAGQQTGRGHQTEGVFIQRRVRAT